MYRTIDEIMVAARQKEINERAKTEASVGEVCDALRGFVDTSMEWKRAAYEVLEIKTEDVRDDPFTARAVSLSILTNNILLSAWEMPRALLSGAGISTAANWRYITEAKNVAMLIDLDVDVTAGFQWLHHKVIEQAKDSRPGDDFWGFAEQAKELLNNAGLEYQKDERDPWSVGVEGKKYGNSVDRSGYVWNNRKFPPEVSDQLRSSMFQAEQSTIRVANSLVHPTLMPLEELKDKVPAMMLTAVNNPLSVMLAYKVAASDLAGWPYTKTVGQQFHVYPPDQRELKELSYMVKEMYKHCANAIRDRYLGDEATW